MCPVEIPRWSTVHAEAWQRAFGGNSSAEIDPLEFRRKLKVFDLVKHDPDALFSNIGKQLRDEAVFEANDSARLQMGTRRDDGSVAAAATKPQGRGDDEHDLREGVKVAFVKVQRNSRNDNKERFVCGKQGHKQRNCPRGQQGKAEEGPMWPEPWPDPQAAAAVHQWLCSAYPEQDLSNGRCICHPFSWWIQDRLKKWL